MPYWQFRLYLSGIITYNELGGKVSAHNREDSRLRCNAETLEGRRCGNYALRQTRPARCFWHFAPNDSIWENLRHAARSKGARVANSQQAAREVGNVLEEAGWPPALRSYVLRSLARGLSGEDIEVPV